MKKPTVKDCLSEIRRLRAENARLTALVESQRPELPAVRAVAVLVRDLLWNLPHQLESVQEQLRSILPPNDADIPTFDELRGCLSDGRDRVEAALDGDPVEARSEP